LGNGALQVFSVNFSQTFQTANEGQAATGDSGGAIFFKNGTTWELAGMIDAIGTLTDQPGSTAVYGDFTNAADIATYRSQIVSVSNVPEPGPSALLVLGGGAIFFAALKKRKRC
jgi:secreted trypsin-like serine protease